MNNLPRMASFEKEHAEDADDNMSIGYSSVTSRTTRMDQRMEYSNPRVATKEQRRVVISKSIMIVVLLLVATGLCIATFLLLKAEEEEDFKTTFENYASEIVAVSKENVESTFQALEALSNSVTSFAKASGQTWPEVVIPDWTSRAIRTAELAAGARLVTMAPFVKADERASFEEYASTVVHDQIQQDLDYLDIQMNATDVPGVVDSISWINISSRVRAGEPETGPFSSEFLVNWQRYPFEVEPGRVFVMNNMLRVPTIRSAVVAANVTKRPKVQFLQAILGIESQVIQPIFEEVLPPHRSDEQKVVGAIWVVMGWGNYFVNLLPEGANGTVVVLESSCGFQATYEVNGLTAEFKGLEDAHDPSYDEYEIAEKFFSFGDEESAASAPEGVCIDELTVRLYPSDTLRTATETNKPALYTGIVAAIFFFTSMVFFIYDFAVNRRQRKVMDRITTQDKIVSNIFPASIRDRLYGIGERALGGAERSSASSDVSSTQMIGSSQKDLMDFQKNDAGNIFDQKPIADLFLETTVMFADIAGFTAWSSAREPSHVFILLENIYGAFDRLSHRYGVFKVETIGDCYVAVAGLPDPRKDHAVVMAKFARECMAKMDVLTKKMEIGLGPDTGDLDIRIGLHSGQVTAGVLRGERSRFQLFGDTVNVASRMESSGDRKRIQMSKVTATLLREQGRAKWVKDRGDILIHGKGMMQTYWLETKEESSKRYHDTQRAHALMSLSDHDRELLSLSDHDRELLEKHEMLEDDDGEESTAESHLWSDEDSEADRELEMTKTQRLVEWNTKVLLGLLKNVVAARTKKSKSVPQAEQKISEKKGTVLEEFEEIIHLPNITMKDLRNRKDPDAIRLNPKVKDQLRSVVQKIADLYNANPFHSFEHASHVTASVAKLLSRIVTSDTTHQTQGPSDLDSADFVHHSYGITSDPLTQFTVVFSAILHDADHPGVPNAQLATEADPRVSKYKGKSVAEQNSVDLVWELLMAPEHKDLRACIYADEEELVRFRQILVNIVMATDIADKELGQLRKDRWNTAFDLEAVSTTDEQADYKVSLDRKATIVLEHLIQASDVSHTMQHWQVYKKWNQKFFEECYDAWKNGRAATDPSLKWYEGEIGFFDFYIIPLAKKLDSCGVFGVSSHEYLSYATANRDEWKRKGKEIVQQFLADYNNNNHNNHNN